MIIHKDILSKWNNQLFRRVRHSSIKKLTSMEIARNAVFISCGCLKEFQRILSHLKRKCGTSKMTTESRRIWKHRDEKRKCWFNVKVNSTKKIRTLNEIGCVTDTDVNISLGDIQHRTAQFTQTQKALHISLHPSWNTPSVCKFLKLIRL